MNIEEELYKLVKNKSGNNELAIFYDEENWVIYLGNPSKHVNLGEVSGELEAVEDTLEKAITTMKYKLDNQKENK